MYPSSDYNALVAINNSICNVALTAICDGGPVFTLIAENEPTVNAAVVVLCNYILDYSMNPDPDSPYPSDALDVVNGYESQDQEGAGLVTLVFGQGGQLQQCCYIGDYQPMLSNIIDYIKTEASA